MAGGEAWLIFCAWFYGGEDPWRLFNRLDGEYRPVWAPELRAVRPKHPDRVKAFVYGCGKVAAILDGKSKDQRRPASAGRRKDSRVVLPPGVAMSKESHGQPR